MIFSIFPARLIRHQISNKKLRSVFTVGIQGEIGEKQGKIEGKIVQTGLHLHMFQFIGGGRMCSVR